MLEKTNTKVNTALLVTAANNRATIVKWLNKEAKANPFVLNRKNKSALCLAVKNKATETAVFLYEVSKKKLSLIV